MENEQPESVPNEVLVEPTTSIPEETHVEEVAVLEEIDPQQPQQTEPEVEVHRSEEVAVLEENTPQQPQQIEEQDHSEEVAVSNENEAEQTEEREEEVANEPECPSIPPPPIPERPSIEYIPKVFSVRYDDTTLDDDIGMEYADLSYVNEDIARRPPPIPAPIPETTPDTASSTTVEETPNSSAEPTTGENNAEINYNIPLPAELVDVDTPYEEKSYDEIIGLVPEGNSNENSAKAILKKMGTSLNKMKDQTSNALNRLLRRSTADASADLLGIEAIDQKEGNQVSADVFDSSMNLVEVSQTPENVDFSQMFGIVSFDKQEYDTADNDSENEEYAEKEERRPSLSKEEEYLPVLMQMLEMSKQVTEEEFNYIKQAAESEPIETERVLRSYLENGEANEFNKLIHRHSKALPEKELRMKVIKNADGDRYEVQHINAITFSVPKIFVYDDTFFFLAELRLNKLSLINKWTACVIQLTKYQIRVFHSLADIAQENTMLRVNLHSLMKIGNIQMKPYRNVMYYYVKLFENVLNNHRVLEDKPKKFRRDLAVIQSLKSIRLPAEFASQRLSELIKLLRNQPLVK